MANTNKPYPASQGRSGTYDAPDPHANTVRNTNGLLRQFFPKGTDLSTHDATELARVEHLLNHRPRKTLGWRTPTDIFTTALAT